MHTDFAPKMKGRYLTSNVNITVQDKDGNPINVPVGGGCFYLVRAVLLPLTGFAMADAGRYRTLYEVYDTEVRLLGYPCACLSF